MQDKPCFKNCAFLNLFEKDIGELPFQKLRIKDNKH